jgi:integral membrane protein
MMHARDDIKQDNPKQDLASDLNQLRRMRLASLFEGTTLAILIFVAVPLRHLAGYRIATMIMGPVHGTAFLLYIWMLVQTISGGSVPKRDALRLVAAAFVPFGAFFNSRILRKAQATLAASA